MYKKTNQVVLKEENVVLLRDEETARCPWKLTKVTELLPGRDSIVKTANVQVLNTDKRLVMLCRPIQYLVSLEVNKSHTVT